MAYPSGGDQPREALAQRTGGTALAAGFDFDLIAAGAALTTVILPLFVVEKNFPNAILRFRVAYATPLMAGMWRAAIVTGEGRTMDGFREAEMIPAEYAAPVGALQSNGYTPPESMQGEFQQAYRVQAGQRVAVKFNSKTPILGIDMMPVGRIYVFGGHVE